MDRQQWIRCYINIIIKLCIIIILNTYYFKLNYMKMHFFTKMGVHEWNQSILSRLWYIYTSNSIWHEEGWYHIAISVPFNGPYSRSRPPQICYHRERRRFYRRNRFDNYERPTTLYRDIARARRLSGQVCTKSRGVARDQ